VTGVLGSSPGRGAERAAALGVPRAYGSLDDLLADPEVQVVHVTSPNVAHFDQVRQILAAGRHVVCEKPLAMTSAQSAEMVAMARAAGTVAAVCYNIRFYPLNQQAQGMAAAGEFGTIRLVSGRYHQDWLAKDSDWNWRLEAEQGGVLRSVGDIGTHWVDLTGFITGLRAVSVMADLVTFVPERRRPVGPVETFAATAGAAEPRQVTTDDAATILLRYPGGARGVMSTSQISHGRKNAMAWEIAGSAASAAWESEVPDHLWIGRRDAPNQILQRDPGLMNATGAAAAALPGGHVEGFADTFRAMFAQIYADVARGGRGPSSTWASFADGHDEMLFCDAVLQSAARGGWVDVAQT
jgi:predicted dehydrogenase